MKVSGIYQIKSIKYPNKVYIGSAINIKNRKKNHLNELRNNKHANYKLQNHYNRHGEYDLEFTVVINCDIDQLQQNEQKYIDNIKPYFNICPNAYTQAGCKRSIETKKKLSESKIGCTPWNKGKTNIYSLETLERIRSSAKQRKLSDTTKQKIRLSMIGKNNWMNGKKLSEQHRINIGNSLRGKKHKIVL